MGCCGGAVKRAGRNVFKRTNKTAGRQLQTPINGPVVVVPAVLDQEVKKEDVNLVNKQESITVAEITPILTTP